MSWRRSLTNWLLLVLVCQSVVQAQDAPRNLALLVGVSEYRQPGWPSLPGAANDVELMRSILLERGFANADIRVLASNQKPGVVIAPPTRRAILEEFFRLRKLARRGDQVIFYYAGHGSQVPAWRGRGHQNEEPDGFDEIILPEDAGKWDESTLSVRNAISDDEINSLLIAPLRGIGVDVVAIFDTCHAESMTRGMEPGGPQARSIGWLALDIPGRLFGLQPKAAPEGNIGCRGTMASSHVASPIGGMVAIYAASESRAALERPVATHGGMRQHGAFTWQLADRIRSSPKRTYRQLVNLLDSHGDGPDGPCAELDGAFADQLALHARRQAYGR